VQGRFRKRFLFRHLHPPGCRVLDAWHVVQRVPLHVPLHHPPGQGHLLAHREHECLAVAGRTTGRPPNAPHVLAWVAGVVKEHHMVHVRKVDAPRCPAEPSNGSISTEKRCQERRSYGGKCGLADADLSVHTRNMESAVCLFRNSLMFVMRWA